MHSSTVRAERRATRPRVAMPPPDSITEREAYSPTLPPPAFISLAEDLGDTTVMDAVTPNGATQDGASAPALTWPTVPSGVTAAPPASPAARYRVGEVMGRGGMGEVVSARDEQIGRTVAIKRLRTPRPSPDLVARFLREARIQGRLEHPAVCPVHELHHDDDGQPFFVMKHLAGITLADVLARRALGDERTSEAFTRQRLLRAFADVCLAIEFAHTRGVVHRDLKPANIMVGDFGEVYVLDWGIARIAGEQRAGSFSDVETYEGDPGEPDAVATAAGQILGTPGYIAPEQIRGDTDLDGRADVYSLGCILFEILALEPLHPRNQAGLASSLGGIDARPSIRAPQHGIPPELDRICVRATCTERAERFATARALHDALQSFLDGDRDLLLRKVLARTELDAAREAMATRDDGRRRDALRAAARALALDPTAQEPAELVARLMLEPPKETPAEVHRELAVIDDAALRASGRFGVIVAAAYLAFFPLLYLIGFREPWYLIAGPLLAIVIMAVCTFITPRDPYWGGYLSVTGNVLMFGLFSWMVSPLLLGPAPAVILVMLLSQHRMFSRPLWLCLLGLVGTLAPWALGALGILRGPIDVVGGDIILHTSSGDLGHSATIAGILIYTVSLVLLAGLLAKLQDKQRRDVRHTLQVQSWQLRQLVPRASSGPRRVVK